ncbi:hypothetical protein B0O80DRAFT_482016 [Mortierella sp. GBAus27b]|nr:hypothetical protein B0O80DRAFT_482016 [Mortierella sp. GBAus27b]
MMSSKLIVLCDGTWCGPETATHTNIHLLARYIGIDMSKLDESGFASLEDPDRDIKACYFRGGGLGSSFFDYLFQGVTGHDVREQCIEVYKYIVRNYSESCEVWMFGLSRGAYTVRCVAGMINKCGIIKSPKTASGRYDEMKTDSLCDEIYRTYRNSSPDCRPSSEEMHKFRMAASHHKATPIKFMGLLDTVGSLGLPKFEGGIGLDYPDFHDNVIPTEVDQVYHACAIHDRLWAFRPSQAVRECSSEGIHEQWFPGCHYDLGRQRFRFFPKHLAYLGCFQGQVQPNHVIADLVLIWMLESIKMHDSENQVIPSINDRIGALTERMIPGRHDTGDGDLLAHGPFGTIHKCIIVIWSIFLWIVTKTLPYLTLGAGDHGLKTIINTVAEKRDRRIPNRHAAVVLDDYKFGEHKIGDLARITKKRYPSHTIECFKNYMVAMKEPIRSPPVHRCMEEHQDQ